MARKRPSEQRRAAPGGPRTRLFLALDPPDAARSELAAWRDRLIAARDELRPVPTMHVTLVFLGWQAEADAERIAAAALAALPAAPPPRLTPAAVKPIPPRGPRLFALDLDDEEDRCRELQAAACAALAEGRFYRPEKRPFWPHLTLARVKRGRRAGALEADELPPPFEGGRVTLYRSTLRPQGAVYDPLASAEVGA